MYFLAFDVGTKKIGIAGGDDEVRIAFALDVLPNDTELFFRMGQIVTERGVGAFVVGDSPSGTDKENPIQKHINQFVKLLDREFGLPIYRINEFGTTVAARVARRAVVGNRSDTARQVKTRHEVHDASAAAMILQRFFDMKKGVADDKQ